MMMKRLMLTSCAAYARKKRKYGQLIKSRLFRNSCKNYAHPKLHRTLSLSMQPLNVHYYALLSHYYLFCVSIFMPISMQDESMFQLLHYGICYLSALLFYYYYRILFYHFLFQFIIIVFIPIRFLSFQFYANLPARLFHVLITPLRHLLSQLPLRLSTLYSTML